MNAKEFYNTVKAMREAQKNYFKFRTKQFLEESKALERTIDAEITKPQWIPVEDKLPMEYEPVLAAFGNHYARVCFYCGGKWFIDAGVVSDEVFGVSHWMQIPPPPKEGGEQ